MRISVENVGFYISTKPIIENVTLMIQTGSFKCLVGINGSGKSTLFNLICGDITFENGFISVQDDSGSRDESLPLNINDFMAIIPQHIDDPPNLLVSDVIKLSRFKPDSGIAWQLSQEDKEAINEAINKCDIHRFLNRRFESLSGGEKQRVWLAFCLAQQKPLLLLDESLSSLDFFTKHDYCAFLKELVVEGKGVLLVTHDIELARQYADTIAVLNNGKIVFDGDPRDFEYEFMR